ncbi:MAG: putative hydrophobic protein (TIGR00271 family) [Planctomycetota bacterium]|jgi:uncharacterized hydrophobic protein (TIGR00271 family)
MVVTLYVDTDANLSSLLPAALRLSVAREKEVRLVIGSPAAKVGVCQPIAADGELIAVIREVLDAEFGTEGWSEYQSSNEESEAEQDSEAAVDLPRLEFLETGLGTDIDMWLKPEGGKSNKCLVAVQPSGESEDSEAIDRRQQFFSRAMCEVVVLRPGITGKKERHGVVLAVGRGVHAHDAASLAIAMGEAGQGPLVALLVQRNIGADSRSVGRRTLARLIARFAGDSANKFDQVVTINDHRHVGILEEFEKSDAEILLIGSTKMGGLGQRLRGTIAQKVIRSSSEITVGVVRAPIPLSGRTQRMVTQWFQRTVPQLEREERIELVERVQSNSSWDFDFITLMSFSTLIAAAGLLVNSSAVIIGAMLVAPLMTPIIGVGMALVQGNPRLIRLALRSVGLGFLNAFILGVVLGLLQSSVQVPTTEMLGRNWPGLLDMFVAFVAGLAGVYSSSRPNLVAALPGVAIAAALVPPIATAGLALSIGDFNLSLGASLLFLTNFVAIVLASALGLWAVGMREGQTGSLVTRVSGFVFGALALGLAFGLSYLPEFKFSSRRPEHALRAEFQVSLGDEFRIEELVRRPGFKEPHFDLTLVGSEPPTLSLVDELSRIAGSALGEPVQLRVRSAVELTSTN